MPDRDVAANAELVQQRVEGKADGGHRRLADFGARQASLGLRGRLRMEEAAQRSADARMQVGDGRIELIELFAEGWYLLVRFAEQPDLLRALAGKEQGDLPVLERPLREHRARKELDGDRGLRMRHPVRHAVAALLQRVRGREQSLGEDVERVRHQREPGIAVRALRERVRHVGQRAPFAAQTGEGSSDLPRELRDHRGASAAEQEQLGARLARRGKRAARLGRLRRLLEHQVHVGAAEPERADAGAARTPVPLPRRLGSRQEERPGSQLELRIFLGDTRLRRQFSVVERESRLDQTRDAGRGHGVSDVRLDASERRADAAARRPSRLVEELAQRSHLDDVADGRGSSVRLEVTDARGRDGRIAICHPQGFELTALARRHRPFAAAVVVRRRSLHHGVDAIPVANRVVEALEHHHAGAFAHHESVGAGVEGTAFTTAGQRPDAAEAHQVVRQQVQVHPTRDREVDLAAAQVDDGLLRGDQRRGAGRVDRERGAAQVPCLGDDGGGHVEQVAGHREGPHRHHVLDQRVAKVVGFRSGKGAPEGAVEELHGADAGEEELLVLADARADEDAGAGALERASLVPGVLQRGAHAVEQQPVLRVGHLDPPWSDPIVERGELPQLLVGEEGALVDVRLVGNAGGRVVEPGMVPARRRDGPEDDRAAADELPVREWVPGAGETAPQPDDRYLQTASKTACRATFKAL